VQPAAVRQRWFQSPSWPSMCVKQGYARVTRAAGLNSFIAYPVINDGAASGARIGDGAFI
jgi:hypothetical protein